MNNLSPLWRELKVLWVFFRLLLTWNRHVAIGYLFGAQGFSEIQFSAHLSWKKFPYGQKLNLRLGYTFYQADLSRGYYK